MSDNVANVQTSPKKIRPEIALVAGKGAQQEQNNPGRIKRNDTFTTENCSYTNVNYVIILACQLARVVRVHVCYYSLRA